MVAANTSGMVQQFLQQYQQTRTTQAKEKREGLRTLQRAANLFGPGYGADIEKAALASSGQAAVSAGLSGTTVPGARAAGISAGLETERRSRLADALSNVAQYQAAFQPITPQPSTIASSAAMIEQRQLEKQRLEEQRRQFSLQSQIEKQRLEEQRRQFEEQLKFQREQFTEQKRESRITKWRPQQPSTYFSSSGKMGSVPHSGYFSSSGIRR